MNTASFTSAQLATVAEIIINLVEQGFSAELAYKAALHAIAVEVAA